MIASLPRREREIFEILCSAGEATAADVRRAMADPPSHSAVRTMLARLEAKGLVRHRAEDQTYVYRSVPQPAKVRETALKASWSKPFSTGRRRAPRRPFSAFPNR